MNKKKSLFITLFITGVLLLTAACGKSSEAEKESAKGLSDISVNDLNDTFTFGKYMFITIDEYDDIYSGYTDVDYFVYTADQPMDNHDLFEEYYVAMFYDSRSHTKYFLGSVQYSI